MSICFLIIGGLIIDHITPSLSIRTHIFVTGHPIGAFRVTPYINEGQYHMDKVLLDSENAMIYTITGGYKLYDRETGNLIVNYKVTKVGFLYLTEGYGQG
jgi:hypothetical protein